MCYHTEMFNFYLISMLKNTVFRQTDRERLLRPYSVGVDPRPGRIRLRGHVEAPGHQILLCVHQVVQVLFVQKTLEELAVVGAGKLHAVVSLNGTRGTHLTDARNISH